MRRYIRAAVVLACLGMCGCNRPPWSFLASTEQPSRGKYTGVGIYGPGKQWTKLIATQHTKDPQAAQPIDDQVIIVVQDSATGEVRACGDLTGYCIGMNPWKSALVSAQIAPIKLTEHVAPDASASAAVEPTAKHAKRHKTGQHGSKSGHAG